jgi:hypothetical protein
LHSGEEKEELRRGERKNERDEEEDRTKKEKRKLNTLFPAVGSTTVVDPFVLVVVVVVSGNDLCLLCLRNHGGELGLVFGRWRDIL